MNQQPVLQQQSSQQQRMPVRRPTRTSSSSMMSMSGLIEDNHHDQAQVLAALTTAMKAFPREARIQVSCLKVLRHILLQTTEAAKQEQQQQQRKQQQQQGSDNSDDEEEEEEEEIHLLEESPHDGEETTLSSGSSSGEYKQQDDDDDDDDDDSFDNQERLHGGAFDKSELVGLILQAMRECSQSEPVQQHAVTILGELLQSSQQQEQDEPATASSSSSTTTSTTTTSLAQTMVQGGALMRLSQVLTQHATSPIAQQALTLHLQIAQCTIASSAALASPSRRPDPEQGDDCRCHYTNNVHNNYALSKKQQQPPQPPLHRHSLSTMTLETGASLSYELESTQDEKDEEQSCY